MKLADLARATAKLDAATYSKEYPLPAIVFVSGPVVMSAAEDTPTVSDEIAEFETTTCFRLVQRAASAGLETKRVERRALPIEPPNLGSRVVFLARKSRWTSFAGVVTLGRATVHDISVPLPTVSRFHASFTELPEGWTIADEGSVNGTFVNGERLARLGKAYLHEGTRVGFGVRTEALFLGPRELFALMARLRSAEPG